MTERPELASVRAAFHDRATPEERARWAAMPEDCRCRSSYARTGEHADLCPLSHSEQA